MLSKETQSLLSLLQCTKEAQELLIRRTTKHLLSILNRDESSREETWLRTGAIDSSRPQTLKEVNILRYNSLKGLPKQVSPMNRLTSMTTDAVWPSEAAPSQAQGWRAISSIWEECWMRTTSHPPFRAIRCSILIPLSSLEPTTMTGLSNPRISRL